MLNFESFYEMRKEKPFKTYVKFEKDGIHEFKTMQDRIDLFKGNYEVKQHLHFKHEKGKFQTDIVFTDIAFVDLFSNRLINLFKENYISGFETFPTIIKTKQGLLIEDFQGFTVTGRCGKILRSMVERKTLPPIVPEGNPYEAYVGLYFDPITWSGDDIFIFEGTAITVVSEKVKAVMEKNEIKDIKFIRLTEAEIGLNDLSDTNSI